jgi:elongation factor P
MIQATHIRKGMLIKIDGIPHIVQNVTHLTPGNKRAMVICGLRNLQTGLSTETRYRSSDRVEEAEIDEVEMEYIYSADSNYYFMNTATYEQIPLDRELIGDAVKFLQPNTRVTVEFFEGKPFGIILPKFITLKVKETQPYLKDATAQSQSKPATLEGGHVCQVPPFVGVGDVIKVNTETGEYVERM